MDILQGIIMSYGIVAIALTLLYMLFEIVLVLHKYINRAKLKKRQKAKQAPPPVIHPAKEKDEYIFIVYRIIASIPHPNWELLGIYTENNFQAAKDRCKLEGDTVVKLPLNIAYSEMTVYFDEEKEIVFIRK